MKKFTPEEIKKKVGKEEKEIREKLLLLSNGMIDVHGLKREQAFERALLIAREWFANGGRYEHKKH
ncbi:hypothetical protein [Croceitalea rosinachiae]|uniref:Uncharacterized protein n=1 Tax=Croceitalea rosinachiae TaxID=3075596 RepID=A0ABU3ADR2_9FLAO|nr:hypothetical protein [Croceitalea sp. F388]MDT0608318.1 hypothetical protein [Croceitalea sp. F388]